MSREKEAQSHVNERIENKVDVVEFPDEDAVNEPDVVRLDSQCCGKEAPPNTIPDMTIYLAHDRVLSPFHACIHQRLFSPIQTLL